MKNEDIILDDPKENGTQSNDTEPSAEDLSTETPSAEAEGEAGDDEEEAE